MVVLHVALERRCQLWVFLVDLVNELRYLLPLGVSRSSRWLLLPRYHSTGAFVVAHCLLFMIWCARTIYTVTFARSVVEFGCVNQSVLFQCVGRVLPCSVVVWILCVLTLAALYVPHSTTSWRRLTIIANVGVFYNKQRQIFDFFATSRSIVFHTFIQFIGNTKQ